MIKNQVTKGVKSTFMFRYKCDGGFYYGLVTANNDYDLFWSLDVFLDPTTCEISKIDNKKDSSFCFFSKNDKTNKIEFSALFFEDESIEWKKTNFNYTALSKIKRDNND